MLHLSVLVKIPKRLSVIRLLGLADVRGENLNTLCRLGKKIHGWPPVNLHILVHAEKKTNLGPCGKKSLNGGEELLHLCVEGGNVLKSGKEVQRQMRRMTIEE